MRGAVWRYGIASDIRKKRFAFVLAKAAFVIVDHVVRLMLDCKAIEPLKPCGKTIVPPGLAEAFTVLNSTKAFTLALPLAVNESVTVHGPIIG